MKNSVTVHILDRDITRRAAVSRTIMGLGMHAEVYEDVGELAARPPRSGVVMVHDDKDGPHLSEVMTAAERRGDYLPITMYASERCGLRAMRIAPIAMMIDTKNTASTASHRRTPFHHAIGKNAASDR